MVQPRCRQHRTPSAIRASARTDNDGFGRLPPKGFSVSDINGQQCVQYRPLSLREWPSVHVDDPLTEGCGKPPQFRSEHV
jgi:hypothetical protein